MWSYRWDANTGKPPTYKITRRHFTTVRISNPRGINASAFRTAAEDRLSVARSRTAAETYNFVARRRLLWYVLRGTGKYCTRESGGVEQLLVSEQRSEKLTQLL